MAHVRMAEAWSNLDFQSDAQREMLIAAPGERYLAPVDRMYFAAIQDTITGDFTGAVDVYRKILQRLPDADRPAGYVDLGMAYERTGDPSHALDNYARASSPDSDNAASAMHTGILQSRLHHTAEANQAFDRAERIFSAEENAEGLAELGYERGYAANDSGDAKSAQKLLQKSLQEAGDIGSVQLQIRVLSQLSSATARFDAQKGADYAQQAIRLARDNRLDAWAANGLVRLAAAEIRQHKFQEAEDNLNQAIKLARESQQLRAEALANVTLASLMDQEHRPDLVIAPAQSALAFYQKNGFFIPAQTASILLIRSQRDKGHYDQALSSANAFLALATQAGLPDLTRHAEELIGSVLAGMERYPDALVHFRNAESLADAPSSQQFEAVFAAEMLWRLGRFAESEEMLHFTPATEAIGMSADQTRIESLLALAKYSESLQLAQKILLEYPDMDTSDQRGLLLNRAIAESHLHRAKEALKDLAMSTPAEIDDPAEEAARNMAIAEISLGTGLAQAALDAATKAAAQFKAAGRLDSELRSACLGASAAKLTGNSTALADFSSEVIDNTNKIQQTWTAPVSKAYFSRPDLQQLLRQNYLAPVPHRR
jgi:hypothetical protein